MLKERPNWTVLLSRALQVLLLVTLMWPVFYPLHVNAQSPCGCSWREPGCQRLNVLGCDASTPRDRSQGTGGDGAWYPSQSYIWEDVWGFLTNNKLTKYIREIPERRKAEFRVKVEAAQRAADAGNSREALQLARKALEIQDDEGLRRWIANLETMEKYWQKLGAADKELKAQHIGRAIELARDALALNDNANLRRWIKNLENQQVLDGMFDEMRKALAKHDLHKAIDVARNILRISDDPDLRDWLSRMNGYTIIEEQLRKGNGELAEHVRRFPAPPSPCPATCVSIGLVVGTKQEYETYHFHVPEKGQAEATLKFENRLQQAGVSPQAVTQYLNYDYVIGLASSTSMVGDVVLRVFWDNLSNGRATPLLQRQYEDLRGMSFGTLDCYSNGAMICLGALSKGDVKVANVRLIGPQLTPLALQQWNELLRRGEIKRLQIFINEGDPVPPLSMVANYLISTGEPISLSLPAIKQILSSLGLQSYVSQNAPTAEFIYLSCASPSGSFLPSCHDLASYSID
jgi:tetratricopeptide (TPR) repeat protein